MTDADKIRELERKLQVAKDALSAAWSDLGQWIRLAEHQQKILKPEPGMKSHAAIPTDAGINSSVNVREQISRALREMQ